MLGPFYGNPVFYYPQAFLAFLFSPRAASSSKIPLLNRSWDELLSLWFEWVWQVLSYLVLLVKENEGSLPHTDINSALSQTPHWSRVSLETLAMRKHSPNNATCGESPGTIRRPPGVRLEDYQPEPVDWASGQGRGHELKHKTPWSPRPVASCKWLLRDRYQTCKSCTQSRSWRVLNGNKETVILQ